MSGTKCIPVQGSHREPVPGAKYVSAVRDEDEVKVTLVLRRRGGDPAIPDAGRFGSATARSTARFTGPTRKTFKRLKISRTPMA
jgi:hypothetical protein